MLIAVNWGKKITAITDSLWKEVLCHLHSCAKTIESEMQWASDAKNSEQKKCTGKVFSMHKTQVCSECFDKKDK